MSAPSRRAPRVLLVSPQPFFENRGTPMRVLQMIRALCAGGYEVELASYPLGSSVAVTGMTHHRAAGPRWIRSVPIGFSWRKIALDAYLAAAAWRLILTRRYDVVHCVEESIFFALPPARMRRIPVVFDLNSSVAHALEYSGAVRSPLLLRIARAVQGVALQWSQLAITVGRSLTEEGVRGLGGTTAVAEIEDCPISESLRDADPAAVAGIRREFGLADAPTVVYTGNLAAYQGVDLLFEALPHLIARCPAARVVIVGGEPAQVDAARVELERDGLAGSVVFAGSQSPSRMADFMAAGDALVSPRRGGQNTPLKLYSYMYAGLPIVATDLPTHTQVLDRTTALLCQATPAALGEALAAVLNRPSDFAHIGLAARARVQSEYSEAAFSKKVLDAYDRLLAGTRTPSTTDMYPRVHGSTRSSPANARSAG